MSVIHLTKDNFETTIQENKNVLVDFWAPWCGPCRMLAPILDDVAKEAQDVIIAKVNIDEEPSLAQQFGVMSIPTLISFKDGFANQKSVGLIGKEQVLKLVK